MKQSLAYLAAITLLGCGEAGGVRFATGALSAETNRLLLYHFEPTETCTGLWMSSDRSRALYGPLATEPLSDEDREEGFTFPSLGVLAGTYVVVVDALNASDALIGSGCAEGQQVFEARVSFTDIVIYPVE